MGRLAVCGARLRLPVPRSPMRMPCAPDPQRITCIALQAIPCKSVFPASPQCPEAASHSQPGDSCTEALCKSSVSSSSCSIDMATLTAAAAMSTLCCARSWAPSSRAFLGGTIQLCCRTGKQHLSMRVVPRIGRDVGIPSTMAQASSAVKGETENASDDSLEAAVKAIEFTGVHHVGFLCENVEKSLDFYCGLLGLEINPNRPNDKLPYGGVWLNVGSPSQMIHLMELPNPDPKEGRPKHGGRDRHACVSVKDVMKIKEVFDKAGVPYTFSQSGRPALFARDPDANALEFSQL